MAIFDRTFAITWALEAVAIVVAMLGAANSLLALVLDRRRELGLLRYLGASGAQIRRMILTEAAFLGCWPRCWDWRWASRFPCCWFSWSISRASAGPSSFTRRGLLLAGALLLVWW